MAKVQFLNALDTINLPHLPHRNVGAFDSIPGPNFLRELTHLVVVVRLFHFFALRPGALFT